MYGTLKHAQIIPIAPSSIPIEFSSSRLQLYPCLQGPWRRLSTSTAFQPTIPTIPTSYSRVYLYRLGTRYRDTRYNVGIRETIEEHFLNYRSEIQ
jgi:hypothetical protein